MPASAAEPGPDREAPAQGEDERGQALCHPGHRICTAAQQAQASGRALDHDDCTQAGVYAAHPCAPLSKLPAEGLQDDMRARYWHRKVVGIQHSEVAKELLHLADQLAHVHLCQVLKPQVLKPVGEDCGQTSETSSPRDAARELHGSGMGKVAHRLYSP